MRYSTEPKYRKYVQGYGFLSFTKKFGDKYGKKLMDTGRKSGKDAAKTTFKGVVKKTAEAIGDLIGNKIAIKITSLGKTKSKEKEDEREEIYTTYHVKKDSKLLTNWDCFKTLYKMYYQKFTNLLGTTPDEVPRFITKK